MLVDMFDAADMQAEFYYGEGFKTWREEIEGVQEFLAQVQPKQPVKE